jgi:hypothetical protein
MGAETLQFYQTHTHGGRWNSGLILALLRAPHDDSVFMLIIFCRAKQHILFFDIFKNLQILLEMYTKELSVFVFCLLCRKNKEFSLQLFTLQVFVLSSKNTHYLRNQNAQ